MIAVEVAMTHAQLVKTERCIKYSFSPYSFGREEGNYYFSRAQNIDLLKTGGCTS